MEPYKTILILILCSILFPCAAGAAELPLGDSGWSVFADPEAIGAVGRLQRPMIYEITDTYISIELDKAFYEMGPMEIAFKRTSQTNVNRIIIDDERVTNDTSVIWFDYHMYLLWDDEIDMVGFNPQYLPSGGQLENVYYSSFDGYNSYPTVLNFVDTDQSGVLFDPDELDEFSPGLISGGIVIDVNPRLLVGDSFIFGQYPTIPEPTTCALLIAGVLPMVFKKKKSHLLILLVIGLLAIQVSAGEFILGESGWTAYTNIDDDVSIELISMDTEFYQDMSISITKTFNNPIDQFGNFSPIIIEFKKTNSEIVVPLINIVQENIINNTGVEWFDYHMFLAVDWFYPEAGFIEKDDINGDVLEDVQFDDYTGLFGLPGQPGSGLPLELNCYNEAAGGVADGSTFTPGNITILVEPDLMAPSQSFLLKQYPTIPEPATVLLLGTGILPAILKRKKQKFVVNSQRG